jgi:hypothetical protein
MNQCAVGTFYIRVISFLVEVSAPEHFVKMSGVYVDFVLSRFSLFSPRLHLLVGQTLRLLGQVQLLRLLSNQVEKKMKLAHPKGMSPTLLREMMGRRYVLGSHNLRQTSWNFKTTWPPKKLQLSVPLPVMATCSPKCKELPNNFYVRTRHVSQSSFGLQHV